MWWDTPVVQATWITWIGGLRFDAGWGKSVRLYQNQTKAKKKKV
jgi:hypothetical protein